MHGLKVLRLRLDNNHVSYKNNIGCENVHFYCRRIFSSQKCILSFPGPLPRALLSHLFSKQMKFYAAGTLSTASACYSRTDTVCPGSSDPPEKIFNIFASENEVYTIY